MKYKNNLKINPCENCKYSRVGFICYSTRDGTCLKDWLKAAQNSRKKEAENHAGSE